MDQIWKQNKTLEKGAIAQEILRVVWSIYWPCVCGTVLCIGKAYTVGYTVLKETTCFS